MKSRASAAPCHATSKLAPTVALAGTVIVRLCANAMCAAANADNATSNARISSRPMRAQERADLPHGDRNALGRLLPREDADLGLRRQHHDLHRDGQRMRRNVVGQHEHRRLTLAYEIAG